MTLRKKSLLSEQEKSLVTSISSLSHNKDFFLRYIKSLDLNHTEK